ncbi:hypothetical protein SDC9_165523 [bioreactor metagenome]|uniref:Uncharacterized protein n=1 Tax=bioreactor metagenome TaxID=1076179 RepID=A0A645FUM3_9ZZZZ
MPADLLDRIATDLGAKGMRQQLAAQTMPGHRQAARIGIVDQGHLLKHPWQAVIDAHVSAHQDQAGVGFGVLRNRIAIDDRDPLPRNVETVEDVEQRPRGADLGVLQDGNRFHAVRGSGEGVLLSVLRS